MSVPKILRERIAPELNHLYTVPPFPTPGGIESGWHSREHALHAFFAARLLGSTADLRSGDFAVLSRLIPPVTSIGTENGHGWCNVGGLVPFDASMTFQFYGRAPQLRTPICGEGSNGDWEVRYARDEALLDEKVQSGNEILFIERRIHDDTEASLLENPFLFLPSPGPADRTSLSALFGPDIYAKISLHCFQCASDDAKSLRHRLARPQAIVWIAENYPAPEARILKQLAA